MNLTEANLARALFDVALARADLRRYSSRANLDGARLTRARLTEANLTGARLTGVNLAGARLEGADLTRANLILANLTHARLDGANLTHADLDDADLDGGPRRRHMAGRGTSSGRLGGRRFRDSSFRPPEARRPVIRGNRPLSLIAHCVTLRHKALKSHDPGDGACGET